MTRTCALLPSSDVNQVCARDVEPSNAQTIEKNACDSPRLYEVEVLYFSIFRLLLRFLYPLFFLKLLLVLCALVALLADNQTDDFIARPFSAQWPKYRKRGRRKDSIWSFTHASSQG